MSGLLIASSKDWEVPWANELILLRPVHPEGIKNGSMKCSHATSVVTVYFGGLIPSSSLPEDAKWEVGIVHRGKVEEESVYSNLDSSNKSLYHFNPDDPQCSFFNKVLSKTPKKRRISALASTKPRVSVYLKDIVPLEQSFAAYKLDKKRVKVKYLDCIDCTVISIHGEGTTPRFFRVSYDHTASVLRVRTGTPTYNVEQYPDIPFPVEQDFQINSYQKVLKSIQAQIYGDAEATNVFETEVGDKIVRPDSINLDLVVMGEPDAFSYEFMDSHLTTVDTLVYGVNWVGLNGEQADPIHGVAYAVFPKKDFYLDPEPFEMHVRARLSCSTCADYFLGGRIEKLENAVHEMREETGQAVNALLGEFDKMRGIGQAVNTLVGEFNKMRETGQAVNALAEEIQKTRKKPYEDKSNEGGE